MLLVNIKKCRRLVEDIHCSLHLKISLWFCRKKIYNDCYSERECNKNIVRNDISSKAVDLKKFDLFKNTILQKMLYVFNMHAFWEIGIYLFKEI